MSQKITFKTIEYAAFNQKEEILKQLKEEKLSGIIIKNFLTTLQSSNLLKIFLETEKKHHSDLPNNQGIVYPKSIYSYRNESDESELDFFKYCNNYNQNFPQIFGIDLFQKITSTLSANSQIEIELVVGPNKKRNYPFSTFRYLNPGFGEMTPHCEIGLQKFASDFLENTNNILNHSRYFSFFILLQKPSKGGDFLIYNLNWDDTKHINNNGDFIDSNNKQRNIKEIAFFDANLKSGDLIVFNGGQLWHTTTLVEGVEPRITFGGFIGFNETGKRSFIWS